MNENMPIDSSKPEASIVIGEWRLDQGLARLKHKNGEEKRLTPKTLQVLLILIEHAGVTVSRSELLDRVWKSTYPSDYVVSRAIADLRIAFGEEAKSAGYIQTVPKLGYRLVADISSVDMLDQQVSTKQTNINKTIFIAVLIIFAICVSLLNTIVIKPEGTVIPLATSITSNLGLEQMPRLAANAEWLVFASLANDQKDWDLFTQSLAGGIPKPLASTDAVEFGPALSPDNTEVAYVRFTNNGCEVVVQAISQTTVQPLGVCTNKFYTLVDWAPEGNSIAYTGHAPRNNGLRSVNLLDRKTGSTWALSHSLSEDETDYYPRFSPDGSRLAFLRGAPKPDHHAHIFIVDIKTQRQYQLTSEDAFHAGITWIDENRLLYVVREGGLLVSKMVDVNSQEHSVLALQDVFQPDYNIQHKVLSMAKALKDIDLSLLDIKEKTTVFIAESTASENGGDLSPDDRWLAFISTRSGNSQLWIAAKTGEAIRQLTQFKNAELSTPQWHKNSETILFSVKQDENRQLYTTNIITGVTQAIDTSDEAASSAKWLPSGNSIIYSCLRQKGWKLCQHNLQTKQTEVILNQQAYDPVIEQDMAYVYFTNDKAGLWRLHPESGKVSLAWANLPKTLGASWTVRNNILYYFVPSVQKEVFELKSRNLVSGQTLLVYRGAVPNLNSGINISDDGAYLVFSSWRSAQDNIVVYKPIVF